VAVSKLLMEAGVENIIGCDREGSLFAGKKGLVGIKKWYGKHTNPECFDGDANAALDGADVFLGLSGPGAVSVDAIKRMAPDSIVFAMANPTPEVPPEEIEGIARVIATGRSDYPNQINNVLCFPGIFRGALDVRAREITEDMKMAAARGIAAVVKDDELREDHIIPSPFNRDVPKAVAAAVAEQAKREGTAEADPGSVGYAPGDTKEFGAIRP
jgi:malate dehydrogenase (oxaloacetate-decarboxylating)